MPVHGFEDCFTGVRCVSEYDILITGARQYQTKELHFSGLACAGTHIIKAKIHLGLLSKREFCNHLEITAPFFQRQIVKRLHMQNIIVNRFLTDGSKVRKSLFQNVMHLRRRSLWIQFKTFMYKILVASQ